VSTKVISSTNRINLTWMFTPSVNPKEFKINPCNVTHLYPLDEKSETCGLPGTHTGSLANNSIQLFYSTKIYAMY